MFCPYEVDYTTGKYVEINPERLAYELIPYGNNNLDEFFDEIKGGAIEALFERKQNQIMLKRYNDSTYHTYMKAPLPGEKSGPEKMKEILDANSVEKVGELTAIHLDCRYNKESGVYSIYKVGEIIAELIPCCPICERRLPKQWLHKDAYMMIGLIAPPVGGKTTYFTSLYANLRRLRSCLGNQKVSHVAFAHYNKSNAGQEGIDYYHEERKREADELVKNHLCPAGTNANYRIAPTFLEIKVGKPGQTKSLFVCIQDNSGEIFKNDHGDERTDMLGFADAQLCFMEAEHFGIRPENQDSAYIEGNSVFSIREQGELQSNHIGETVRGEDLLNANNYRTYQPVQMLENLYNLTLENDHYDNTESFINQHIAFTIIKCDLLRNRPEFINRQKLFEGGETSAETLWDDNQMYLLSEDNEDIFNALLRLNSNPQEIIQAREIIQNFSSQSWHMISALGTGTTIINGTNPPRYQLDGPYDPIRLMEPLATCIVKKIKELGW